MTTARVPVKQAGYQTLVTRNEKLNALRDGLSHLPYVGFILLTGIVAVWINFQRLAAVFFALGELPECV
jgi:hypothetical protein